MTFAEKIRGFFTGKKLESEIFEELSDLLVEGDFGATEAFALTGELEKRCKKEQCENGNEARNILKTLLCETLSKARPARVIAEEGDSINAVLLLGVNGVGKTTTAAKLCARYSRLSPVLAAADTFRAGAIDQLKTHGTRLGVRVIAQNSGGDPAAVCFDAMRAAQSGKHRLVVVDTAGRMHTKTALVEELKKIDRAVKSAANSAAAGGEPAAPFECLKYLVLDATTGRNALSQAEVFNEAVELDGVILSKCDSTAKGGAAFTLAGRFALPVVYLCAGESYRDISDFNAADFAERFLGI